MNRSLALGRTAAGIAAAIWTLLDAHASQTRIHREIRANEPTALHGSIDPRAVLGLTPDEQIPPCHCVESPCTCSSQASRRQS